VGLIEDWIIEGTFDPFSYDTRERLFLASDSVYN
jgi:hypothetical protein